MAIFMAGKSRCPICGKVIDSIDEAIATPAFLKNTHPLAKFSDAVLHKQCFAEAPEREDVERLLSRFKEVMAGGPRTGTVAEYESWVKGAMREFE